ncbi:MAG: hypothetical protein LBQ20_05810 [Rhodanobacter sp.]|jgi:uncharacterized lipoprotein NlpE involved in copper resistance|nr:hypothetical protein [Rhodanobacter sp.]
MINKQMAKGIPAAMALALALAGCANKSNPDNIDRRVVERWDYLIAHQAEKAYDYLTPGVRTTRTREDYAGAMNNRPLQWKSVKFNRKECDGDSCTAYVNITYELKLPSTGRTTQSTRELAEKWILVQGEWYYLPDK